ncbi:hypothetical protein [Streptomyces lincolnensis]|uniref:hypothetical protein n=1 Tax=Streptomyces lincolnensis TaxID=1915 RepID=UPI0013520EB3|nr:hypothetical protein [Streptomyces lincolnensis]QMV11663.1 hypothetical protein GJU35_42305 [Streptomyces lincolnensis]
MCDPEPVELADRDPAAHRLHTDVLVLRARSLKADSGRSDEAIAGEADERA